MKFKLIAIIVGLFLASCGGDKSKKSEDNISKAETRVRENFVDTVHLSKGVFNKQIVCNGKLRAVEKSNLNFSKSGLIQSIRAYNGSTVAKGELLAVVDTVEAQIALNQAGAAMKKAYLDLLYELIGQGYGSDTTKVPANILQSVKMKSGYNTAIDNVNTAKRSLGECYLYAPFSGRIGNMDSKKHQNPVGEQFCTLINDSFFDVEFSLLEAELTDVKVGQEVMASLFIDETKQFTGKVIEINPIVDDKGQIKVRARVANKSGELLEGMNVNLVIEKKLDGLFVVPKDAVVSRDGYFVVFRYVDGVAVWTYVDITMSNMNSHVITGNAKKQTKISEKDVVIVKGNLNLADGTKVTINN